MWTHDQIQGVERERARAGDGDQAPRRRAVDPQLVAPTLEHRKMIKELEAEHGS